MNKKPSYEQLEEKVTELIKKEKEYHQIKTQLQEEKEKFKSLVANIPGIIYRCKAEKDWEMQFISDSIKEHSGYSASDFLHAKERTFASIIHPEDKALVEKVIFSAVEKQQSYTIEYRIIDSNNEIHWFYEKGRPVFGKDGNVIWLDGAIFDVTDRKKLEEEKELLIADLAKTLAKMNKINEMHSFYKNLNPLK